MTTGTKTAATWSTSFWIGAFEPCASSTIFAMRASTVSSPTAVASTRMTPFWFIVPPITGSPVRRSTGIDSPVIIDSSTRAVPVAHDAVDRDLLARPHDEDVAGRTRSIGSSTSAPSRMTRADFADMPSSARIADDAAPFDRSSKYLPIVMKTSTAADTSKNMS